MPEERTDDLARIWGRTCEDLRASLPAATFELWLAPLQLVGIRGSTLYLAAPDRVRSWVERRYGEMVHERLRRHAPELDGVRFLPPSEAGDDGAGEARTPAMELSPAYTFERFVIGPGNRFAHGAALSVAEVPTEAYNPLFLYGPPGLGKTHLLGAIAHYVRSRSPGLTVHYTTAERFTNEFVSSLSRSTVELFKQRYRHIDVLLIDDVQFLERKARTEEEFFHTFNALYEAGSQLVLSSDRRPQDLSDLAERLRDRFEWGLLAPVDCPDPNTRLTILRHFAREENLSLPDPGALSSIASRVPANVRQLRGALTRVTAFASLMGRPIDTALVDEVLATRPATERPDTESVSAAVANVFSIEPDLLTGPGRAPHIVLARQVAMYLCRELTPLSLPSIGRAFGRDHTTVLHAVRRISSRMEGDPELGDAVHRATVMLEQAVPVQSC